MLPPIRSGKPRRHRFAPANIVRRHGLSRPVPWYPWGPVNAADTPEDFPDDPAGRLAWLLHQSHETPPGSLDNLVAEAMHRLGAAGSCMYLIDHDQGWLHPFGSSPEDHVSQQVAGTVAGRSFALQATLAVRAGDGVRLWVPLIDGTARLGTLAVDFPGTAAVAPDRQTTVEQLAGLAAELIVSKARYTDTMELTKRRRPMSLQAEMQRGALPPDALVTREVAVAGILLPAYEVAGDSFDYSLNDHRLDVAMIDSVGHDLESSMVSHLVTSALRNARRNGLDLTDTYKAADAAVRRIFPDLQFATAAFGRLELRTGRFRWVSAGHPPPLLIRGGKVVGEAAVTPVYPIGLQAPRIVVNEVGLEPGDGLLIYTDGVTEGGVRGSERFGIDRLVDLLGRTLLAALPIAEAVRRLATAVLEHTAYELHDDTTLLLVEYRQAPP
jgi:serine phosphatase RsbU (regulator of sigma subunit)